MRKMQRRITGASKSASFGPRHTLHSFHNIIHPTSTCVHLHSASAEISPVEVCRKEVPALPEKTTLYVYNDFTDDTFARAYRYGFANQFSVKDRVHEARKFAQWYTKFATSLRLEIAWNYWWQEVAE